MIITAIVNTHLLRVVPLRLIAGLATAFTLILYINTQHRSTLEGAKLSDSLQVSRFIAHLNHASVLIWGILLLIYF